MTPMLKPPGTKRLKLEYDGLLSNFGLNFNLRRYSKWRRRRGGWTSAAPGSVHRRRRATPLRRTPVVGRCRLIL